MKYNQIVNYVYFAWIASIVYGLEVVIGKFTSNRTVTNPWLFNFAWSLLIIILILPFAVANGAGLPYLTLKLFLVSASYATCNILYIISLQKLDVTVMGPLFNFRTVFSVLLGVILLGETLTPFQTVLIGVIFIGGILANIDEKQKIASFFRKDMIIFMAFLLVLALLGVFTNLAIAEASFWPVSFWSMVYAQILMLPTVPLFTDDFKKTKLNRYSGLILMSLASAVGTLAANQAYAGNVGITSTIISIPFSMIFTIIISIWNPKLLENHPVNIYMIRLAAAAVMLIAALRLSG